MLDYTINDGTICSLIIIIINNSDNGNYEKFHITIRYTITFSQILKYYNYHKCV